MKKGIEVNFQLLIPFGVGILAAFFLSTIYFVIVSWAETLEHAVQLFWEDAWLIIPILAGFGIQAGLYTVLKMRLHLPVPSSALLREKNLSSAPRASMATGGTASTTAMVACCAHHLTDILPFLGLTAAATFLAKYQTVFMAVGFATNLIGIGVILNILLRERRAVLKLPVTPELLQEEV